MFAVQADAAGEFSDKSGPGFSSWKFDREMEVIANVRFFKDAHSVFLCRLLDDLFYFAKVFVEPENALFCFKREMDRKPCGDRAFAFGVALQLSPPKESLGALRPLNSNCFLRRPMCTPLVRGIYLTIAPCASRRFGI